MIDISKKEIWDYEIISMAWHEAGHAACALNNFMHVFNVSVMTPKNQTGNTDWFMYDVKNVEDEELSKILFICELQTLYAGLIAEKMYYKDICGSDKFPMHLKIGSSMDTTDASHIIRKNKLVKPGRQTVLFKKQIQQDATAFLVEHWDAVRVIAHRLYKKHRLSFDELKFLLTRKTNHKEFWKEKFKKIKIINDDNTVLPEQVIKDIILEDVIFSI